MHVEVEGPQDAPRLVLLHGGIGTGRYHWSKLVEPLARRFRLLLPDLPGHGRTPLSSSDEYSREVLVSALRDLLEEVGGETHVAGFSMGGQTALALAADRPDLFASLVLIGVSTGEHAGLGAWRESFVPERFEQRYPLWVRALSRIHEPLGGPDAWRDVLRRDSSGLAVDVDFGALRAFERPILLIRGDRDPAIDPAQYAHLREVWPHAEEFVVPGGQHDVQLTRQRVVEPVLVEFFERVLK